MTPEEAKDLKAGRGCPYCVSKEICQREETCNICPLYRLLDEIWDSEEDELVSYDGRCRANAIKPIANDARYIQRELAGILGDDIDGLAASMEDFGLI